MINHYTQSYIRMKLNKQIFNLMANFFGLAANVEKKETESK